MPTITFIEPDGNEKTIITELGYSVMEVAIRNGVDGIIAECGGQCSCATCHVYVEQEFFEKVGPAVDDEEDMLEFADGRQPNSRLGCQIGFTEDLDGLVVRVVGQDA